MTPLTSFPISSSLSRCCDCRKNTILVRSDEDEIVKTIESWMTKESVDEALIGEWSEQGKAFWNVAASMSSIHEAEAKKMAKQVIDKVPDTSRYAANMYVKVGADTDPVFVKTSKSSETTSMSLEGMMETGSAFKNLSSLAVQESVINRADGIANRLQSDFSLMSPEWKRWTDMTDSYNATSLQQVIAAYYQDYSIADVGRNRDDYVPRRGFPGTLAPGEKFKDNYAIDDLERRVLHPWPAMQQFRWHVRMPTTHPMIPPPLLWLALNDMYTSNFTESQLAEDCDEVVGGTYMNPRDALRIARDHRLGASYEESEQIPHGGSLFPGGHQIPHYNPDHGPTIPVEESAPPIPEELLPITNRWMDPHYGLRVELLQSARDEQTQQEEEDEEDERRSAAMRLGLLSRPAVEDSPGVESGSDSVHEAFASPTASKFEKEVVKVVNERRRVLYGDGDAIDEEVKAANTAPADPEAFLDYGTLPSATDQVRDIMAAVGGKARNKIALIDYEIATVRDLRTEVDRVEKDSVTRKKAGRRKTTRKKTASSEATE